MIVKIHYQHHLAHFLESKMVTKFKMAANLCKMVWRAGDINLYLSFFLMISATFVCENLLRQLTTYFSSFYPIQDGY